VAAAALDPEPLVFAGRPLPIDPGIPPVAMHVQVAAKDADAADHHQSASVSELDG